MSYPPYGGTGGAYPAQGGYPSTGGYSAGYGQSGGPMYPAAGYQQPGQVAMPEPFGAPGAVPYHSQPNAQSVGFQTTAQSYGQGYPQDTSGYQQGGSCYPPGAQGGPGYPSVPQGFGVFPAPTANNPISGGYGQQPGIYPHTQSSGAVAYGGQTGPSGYPPTTGGYGQTGPSGYPPTTGGYGQTGPSGYPPNTGGYGQTGSSGYPPTTGGYGQTGPSAYASTTGGYGAYGSSQQTASATGYPTGAQSQYVSLPQGLGTVKPSASFNAEEDAKVLRKAMKGFGTDEKAIIDVLAGRSNQQRQEIKNRFKTMFGKDLMQDLKSELSGRFEELVIALLKTPTEFDAEELRDAMQGAGTDERALIEILCTRNNRQILDIKNAYKLRYSRDLEKDLMSEASGNFRRLLVSLSTGNRMENPNVDVNKAKQDAMELYQAGEKKIGTDESKFNQILCSQSYEQLRVVFQEYKNLSKKSLDQVIRSEMSGDLEDGMLAIYNVVLNKHHFFAERLYKSMKGAGTKDRTLIRIVVSRCEVDMVQIKQDFQRQYGQTLESFIEGDTSGDYKKLLLALVRGY